MAKTKTLTTTQLTVVFAVSSMTIANWRKGIVSRDPLPTEIEGRSVGFAPAKIKAWAKKYKVEMTCDPMDMVSGLTLPAAERKVQTKPEAKKVVAKKAATAVHQKKAPVKNVGKELVAVIKASAKVPVKVAAPTSKSASKATGTDAPKPLRGAAVVDAPKPLTGSVRRVTTTQAVAA